MGDVLRLLSEYLCTIVCLFLTLCLGVAFVVGAIRGDRAEVSIRRGE